MKKICTECGVEKELSEFYKDSRASTKTTPKCKHCIDKYQKAKASTTEYKQYRQTYMDQYMKIYQPTEHTLALKKERKKASIKSGLNAEYSRRRRALLRKQDDGTITMEYLSKLLTIQNNKCYYCSIELDDSKHLDHYVPIAKGGLHSISNVVWSCPSCNFKKHATLPDTHYPTFPIGPDDKNHIISSII